MQCVWWEIFEKRGEEIWFAKCRLLEQTIYSFHWSPHFVFQNAHPFVQDTAFSLIWCLADLYTLEMFFASALWLLLEVCSCNEYRSYAKCMRQSVCPTCTSVSHWKNGWATLSSPNCPRVFFKLVHLSMFCTHHLPCYEYQRACNMPGSMLHNL